MTQQNQQPFQTFAQPGGAYQQQAPAQQQGWPQQAAPAQQQQGWPTQQQAAPAQQQAPAPAKDLGTIADLVANAGGIPGAFNKHSQPGEVVAGTITKAEVRQVHDYNSSEPEFWDNGDPKLQLQVVVQTGQTDPAIENDTGERAIYIKWWGEQRQNLLAALRAADDTDVRVGGQFMAKFAGIKPNSNPRLNDVKVYEYAYEKPGAGVAGLAAPPSAGPSAAPAQQQATVQQQATAQQQAPVQQQAPAPAAPSAAPVQQPPAEPANPLAEHQQQQQAAAQDAAQQDPWGGGQAVFHQAGAQQPATPTATVDVNEVKRYIGLGLDDQSVSGATGATIEQVAAIRAHG